jgi:hypothetical protein
LIKGRELTTNEALGFFGKLQNPLNKNRERGGLIEGKNWDEAENRGKISGNFEQGEEAFGHISQGFASKHSNFDLFSEQKKLRGIQGSQIESSSQTQSNNPYLTQEEINNNYLPINNEKEVSRDQLGIIQRTEQELTQNVNVPFNMGIPVATGLAFVLNLTGIS